MPRGFFIFLRHRRNLELILLSLCFIGMVISQESFERKTSVLFHGRRNDKKLALTFDACPSSTHGGFDARIVNILVDSGVPTTFFFSGRWLEKHRSQVKNLASVRFFEFGDHGYSHRHMIGMKDSVLRSEFRRTESLLRRVTGGSARLFRSPYAELDTQIVNAARNAGLTTVMYDLASGDPDSTLSPKRIARYVISKARNGSIIVMHVNGRGWHTAEILPEIIQALRKKGFTLVRVSDLLDNEGKSSDSKATGE
jgi:peptidoglycan/xylan/chitin deacetylase (PgdA/CDA1 family)